MDTPAPRPDDTWQRVRARQRELAASWEGREPPRVADAVLEAARRDAAGEEPDPDLALRGAVLARLGPAADADDGLRAVTTRVLDAPSAFRHRGLPLGTGDPIGVNASPLTWFWDIAAVADAYGLVDDAEHARLVEAAPRLTPDSLRRVRLRRATLSGDLDLARSIAQAYDRPEHGWADIGEALATTGDVDAFFGAWPKGMPAVARKWRAAVGTLVTAHAARDGWRAALGTVRTHRSLGEKYALVAVWAAHEQEDYDTLLALLEGELADLVPPTTAFGMLARALVAAHDPANPVEDARLVPLVERMAAEEASKDLVRARDGALLTLWPAMREASTLKRAKQVMRTPALKREMTVLPADVRRRTDPPA